MRFTSMKKRNRPEYFPSGFSFFAIMPNGHVMHMRLMYDAPGCAQNPRTGIQEGNCWSSGM